MNYSHEVEIVESGGGAYDSGTKTWSAGTPKSLWKGKADVQEEPLGVHYKRDVAGGETSTGRLEVFFKPQEWKSTIAEFLRLELIVITPIGTAPLQAIRHLDQMVIVQPTKDA